MERRRANALARALRHLNETVERYRSNGANALPSVVSMAKSAGVATLTMRRAVVALAEAGTLEVVARKGVYIRTSAASPGGERARAHDSGTPHDPPTGYRGVARALSHDILSSRYGPGSKLPAYKTLCAQYRASYRTVRRALGEIVQEGLVAPCGRGFEVRTARRHTAGSRIVVVAATDTMLVLGSYSPRSSEFWRTLSRECHFRNVGTDVYGGMKALGTADWSDGRRQTALVKDRDEPVLGYLLMTFGTSVANLRDLTEMLGQTKRPVAVLHENAHMFLGDVAGLVRNRRMRVFETAATPRCGEEVGRHLIRLGHRRVGFFYAPRDDVRWLKRLAGIRRAYRDAGMPDAVQVFCPEGVATQRDFDRAMSTTTSDRLLAKLSAHAAEIAAPTIHEYESSLQPGIGARSMGRLLLPQMMVPVFEEALTHTDMTAWVGPNDEFAQLGLSYLRRHGVRVPEQISVVGFDNSLDAIGFGLSSYDFGTESLVRSALDHILGPEGRPGDDIAPVLEIPGTVVERSSSGPAATR